jgi:hypothetical protein
MKGKFGEPWNSTYKGYSIEDADGNTVSRSSDNDSDDSKRVIRACECVNALDGIEDPAAFMELVKKLAWHSNGFLVRRMKLAMMLAPLKLKDEKEEAAEK